MSNTFPVIIKFQTRKYEPDPDNPGKQRVAIGYGNPIIFHDDDYSGDSQYMTCVEGWDNGDDTMTISNHSAASVDYFLHSCHHPKTKEEKRLADKFFKCYTNWCKSVPGDEVPVRRTRRMSWRLRQQLELEAQQEANRLLHGIDDDCEATFKTRK